MVIRLLLHRWRGACFVWTVHNVKPHEVRNPKVTAALMRFVLRALDGAIFLTAASRDAAVAAMPELSSKPFRVIPHGPYEVLAEASLPIAEARARFALPKAGTVVGFVGDIRPYKGLDILLDAFSQTNPGRATLFIAGSFQTSAEYADAQREKIARLREQGHSVVFWDQRPDDTQLAAAIRACDINVLPYRNITNSGLAIMIIGCGGRILCSDATAFRELRDELGPTWVQVAESQVTGADLLAALEMVSHEPAKDALDAFRAARSWPMIGERTLEFYRDLLSGKANREI
jgi:glycosyltransferase involved in cell wall biosynthesis